MTESRNCHIGDALITGWTPPISDDQIPSNGQIPELEPRRDEHGRYVKAVSGNPKGKPAGILNAATRAAAMLLDASAPVLVSKAIELALLGKIVPLKLCLGASNEWASPDTWGRGPGFRRRDGADRRRRGRGHD